jgi:hypothetical protein
MKVFGLKFYIFGSIKRSGFRTSSVSQFCPQFTKYLRPLDRVTFWIKKIIVVLERGQNGS